MLPSVGCTRSATTRIKVVLPQPDGADQRNEFAAADGQVDILQRRHRHVRSLIDQGQTLGLDHGLRVGRPGRRRRRLR